MSIVKQTLKVNIPFPKKDLSKWEDETKEFSVTTEFNPDTNNFTFRCQIPQFVFDAVKDTDYKYRIVPAKPDHAGNRDEPIFSKFTKSLSSATLGHLLGTLSDIFSDALTVMEKEKAESEKYIAVKFSQGSTQQRDSFNHADMGFRTISSFQFFTVYKLKQSALSLNPYIYRTNKRVDFNSSINSVHHNMTKEWAYYGERVLKDFKLIKWTQEREDYLTEIQDKFVEINKRLDDFLGDVDDDKIELLMQNKTLFLGK